MRILFFIAVLLISFNAVAEEVDITCKNITKSRIASGVRQIKWSKSCVPTVYVKDLMPVTIQFPEDEIISNVVVGNEGLFGISQLNHGVLVLKANAIGIDSTLTASGVSGNTYVFKLHSLNTKDELVSDILINIENLVENNENDVTTEYELPKYVKGYFNNNASIVFAPLNIFARAEEDKKIAPVRIWQDKDFTYLDFGENAHIRPRPVVSLLVDGIESPVNTKTIGDNNQVIVVEAIGEFVLRHGQSLVCLKKNKKQSNFKLIGWL